MGRSLTASLAAALAIALCGDAQAAEPAPAKAATPGPVPVIVGEKAAFATAEADGAKHLGTGFICPPKLAGLIRSRVRQQRGAQNDGSGTCSYGGPEDQILVTLQISPQGKMSKAETLEFSADMSGMPPDAQPAPQLLPLGVSGGPELGRFARIEAGTLGIWLGFKDQWWIATVVGYEGDHAEQARAVGTAVYKAFQETVSPTP